MAHDVFISYSNKDKPAADAACAPEGAGVRCWMAPRDIQPGRDWGEAIVDGIENSRVFVLIFSDHANQSHQVKREVERAVSKGLSILPLRIEQVEPSKALEYFLSMPHWLDAITPPLEQHLGRLVSTVQSLLGHAAASPVAPAPATARDQTDDASHFGSRGRVVRLVAVAVVALLVLGGVILAFRKKPDTDRPSPQPGRSPAEQRISLLATAAANDGPTSRPALVGAADALLALDPNDAAARAFRRRADLYDPAWWAACAAAGGPGQTGELAQPPPAAAALSVGTWGGLAAVYARLDMWPKAVEVLSTGARAHQHALSETVAARAESAAGAATAVDVEPLVAMAQRRYADEGIQLGTAEVEWLRERLYFAIFAARIRANDVAGAKVVFDAHPPRKEAWRWQRLLAPAQARAGDRAGYEIALKQMRSDAAELPAGTEQAERRRDVARAAARAGDRAGLEQALAGLGEADPAERRFNALWDAARAANWWAMAGDRDRAAEALKRFTRWAAMPEPGRGVGREQEVVAAVAYARLNDFASALALLRSIDTSLRATGQGTSAAARLAIDAGQPERAAEMLLALDPAARQGADYAAAAAALAGRGLSTEAVISALRSRAAEAGADRHTTRVFLAQAHVGTGDLAAARRALDGLLARAAAMSESQVAKMPDSRLVYDLTGPVAAVMARAGMWEDLPLQIGRLSNADDRARACLGVAHVLIDLRRGPPGRPAVTPAFEYTPEYAGWIRPVNEMQQELD